MSEDELSLKSGTETQVSNVHFDLLGKHMESYNVETSAVHRKLQSKVEALRILRKELEKFRVERDQYKLMAETLQLRYTALKRNSEIGFGCTVLGSSSASVASILHDTRERNLKLSTEVESLKQKLSELQGDIKLLRAREVHMIKQLDQADDNKEQLAWKAERANFICHLENLKKKNAQLSFDFKALIDEKQDMITERDAYKCKAHRLNHELFVALKANAQHPKFLDIDAIILENKYLHERLKHNENELEAAQQSVEKYKSILETKRKKGIIKLGSSSNDEKQILSSKQVKTMLESGIEFPTKTETLHDLKSICLILLDNLNDKNLALNHQKKTNKLLAMKIAELQQRIQGLTGDETNNNDAYGFAPSQFLLNGYCPSMVDLNDGTESQQETTAENSYDITPIEEDKRCVTFGLTGSDDGMSSLSTESVRSVISSEYGADIAFDDYTKNLKNEAAASSATTDSGNYGFDNGTNKQTLPRISSAIARQRCEDLKDLPPHLVAIVQQALNELDMLDYNEQIIHQRAHVISANKSQTVTDRLKY